MKNEQPESNLPTGLSAPAQRALAGAGLWRLEQLSEISEAELKRLHGIGPNAVRQLRAALDANGLSFAEKTRSSKRTDVQTR